ncbi:cytochrome d ubiquinol oxidase, subunit II [Chloroherpeton thalassium ATCC 35110]|uniref:Cytochrome d ubiquinol oxidase, subunit II n=1 Tax=Chloroherpeton thalassium (strain ATCC 35110 / GB-78) TaxID=517418 RepID=B3QXC1_CHLT3|nr:cytochrome d ubiquinol oxidase subunit II [Chloroherpeton thalassium]ACF13395.1 cytochrome d ubiquinol oxidase, subunit II [Chloroherpeton thalassium ATCC 35110]
MDLNTIWYLLIGVLLIGYAILDGFDLGVGALHLLAKDDNERRLLLNSIGPVWDGNEVWLITGGGALFAAFPHAYATAFSGFYLAFMLLLVSLISRAVSIEFRSKRESQAWRNFWDYSFSIGSVLSAILFGVAIGNMVAGIKIGSDMEYAGTFFDLLTPYTVLAGVFNLALFTMHGAIYLFVKTEGDLQERVKGWAMRAFFVFLALYVIVTAATLYMKPEMIANFSFGKIQPATGSAHELIQSNQVVISVFAWIIVILNGLAIANIPRTLVHGKELQAFLSSACTIAALVFLFAVGVFPNMITSSLDPAYSLTIYNAASSEKTLFTMLIMALIGMPLVLSYTISIYWVFRGKTTITKHGY